MGIPNEIKAVDRWVCYDARNGQKKMPIDPATNRGASSTDPSTWGSYAAAAEAARQCQGVGFVLGDGYSGIDIDHCVDLETGQLSPLAQEIIDTMDSYAEYSPSGTGIHILWRGQKPPGACKVSSLGLEMYSEGRYFTVTGNTLRDRPLMERTEQAAAVHRKFMERQSTAPAAAPAQPVLTGMDDAALIAKARASEGGEKFSALMAGDYDSYYASHSEADLALCNLLAFWFGCDKARMDAMFRSSGLYRKKWDERRGRDTYGNLTLQQAIDSCQEVYTPPPPPPAVSQQEVDELIFSLRQSRRVSQSVPDSITTAAAPGKKQYSMDDTGNAQRFRDLYGDRVLYNYTAKAWMVWTGTQWRVDDTEVIKTLVDEMLDRMEKELFGYADPAKAKQARAFLAKSRSSKAKENLLREVQHLPGIPCKESDFDKANSLMNLPNGILRLAKGELIPHDHTKRMSKLAGVEYDPAATAPCWEQFLRDVTGNDADLIRFLQCMVGYMLTGSIKEQCMFFLYGDGSNGKSTFLEVLQGLFGSYAMNAQADTITSVRRSNSPRTDIARLKNARLVTLSESDDGAWLDESLIKQLTGGDSITARHLYGREFEFKPEFKMVMATNHKPRIRGTDAGIWRRIRLVPFTQSIPENKQDLQLPEKLRAELPGILNWALEGLRLWLEHSDNGKHRGGIPRCAAVEAATAEYRVEQDRIKAFLDECTVSEPGCSVQSSVLYQTYRAWAQENGERFPYSSTKFGREAAKLLTRIKTAQFNQFMDLALTVEGQRFANRALGVGELPPGKPPEAPRMAEPEQLAMTHH